MNTNVSGHQHIYLVQESYLPLPQYPDFFQRSLALQNSPYPARVCHQTQFTPTRTYVDGYRGVSMLLHKNRWTWESFSDSNICRNIFEMSPVKAIGSSRKRSKTQSKFSLGQGPLSRKQLSETSWYGEAGSNRTLKGVLFFSGRYIPLWGRYIKLLVLRFLLFAPIHFSHILQLLHRTFVP